jgi:hypothetical protein
MEQVNLQELQRLNDAINLTFDAIRRVAPQLQALQHYWLQQQIGMSQPYSYGQPYGQAFQPFGIPQMQHPFAQQFGWQQPGWGLPFGGPQSFIPPIGVNPFVQRPY